MFFEKKVLLIDGRAPREKVSELIVQKFVKKRENVKSAKNQGFKLFGVCMSKRILTPLKGIHQVRI